MKLCSERTKNIMGIRVYPRRPVWILWYVYGGVPGLFQIVVQLQGEVEFGSIGLWRLLGRHLSSLGEQI